MGAYIGGVYHEHGEADVASWRADMERLREDEEAGHARIERALGRVQNVHSPTCGAVHVEPRISALPVADSRAPSREKERMTAPQLLPLAEAASVLRVPATWLRVETRSGRLPSVRCGSRTLVHVPTIARKLLARARLDAPGDPAGLVDILPERSAARDSWTLDRMAETAARLGDEGRCLTLLHPWTLDPCPCCAAGLLSEIRDLLRSTGRDC